MSLYSPMTEPALRHHVDIFVNNFFVNGARNCIRKTTANAPWLNLGIMERANPEAFYSSLLFAGMNIVGGGAYSLGHGFIHGYLDGSENAQITRAVANLNALGADEIIFYHDESVRGLDTARELGLDLQFAPISLLEWLIRQIKKNWLEVRHLDMDAAVQLPCSWKPGDGKNKLLDEFFDLIGIQRVERRYDLNKRLCCGFRGYFGLTTGDTESDTARAEQQVRRNVEDAKQAGAHYIVTTCPFCYAALASTAREAGLIPIQIEGLASLALHNTPLPQGLACL